jgi:methionine-rich copper-binding protein CopC
VTAALFLASACASGSTASPSAQATAAVRPSSPAVLTITEPPSGSVQLETSVHVVLTLTGAQIVSATTTNIRPDEGHIHLYVNNALVSMNYGLDQDFPVVPGTYVLKAEFVAADHGPFNPRVWSPEVFFTVR